MIRRPPRSTLFPTRRSSDLWNRKTTLTFSGPVEIPGVHLKGWGVLPAGTYVFKVLDSQSDRHRSEEHTSELQSRRDLVCRLLLEKKKKKIKRNIITDINNYN